MLIYLKKYEICHTQKKHINLVPICFGYPEVCYNISRTLNNAGFALTAGWRESISWDAEENEIISRVSAKAISIAILRGNLSFVF